MKLLLLACLVMAPFSLALGIVLPLVRFETLLVFEQAPSLIGIVAALAAGGDWVLAGIVALVSIAFPIAKMFLVMAGPLGLAPSDGRAARLLPHLARWSLMDVLLVAVVIVAAKTGGIAAALTQPGLWFYAGSAALAAAAHALSHRVSGRI